MEPEQRVGFAAQNGMPIQVLLELESIAGRMGLDLAGGSCKPLLLQAQSAMGGGDEGGMDFGGMEGEDDGAMGGAGGSVSALDVLSLAREKALGYAGGLAFFLAVPLFLVIIAKRRDLSAGDLVRGIFRLPFSD
jgi:hypothetical protein